MREELDDCNAERQKLRERELQQQETESGMLLRYETKKKELQGMLKAKRRYVLLFSSSVLTHLLPTSQFLSSISS